MASKSRRHRLRKQRRRQTQNTDGTQEVVGANEETEVTVAPSASVSRVIGRRKVVGNRITDAGTYMQAGALAVFGLSWLVFHRPHLGTLIGVAVAVAGFVAFWTGEFIACSFAAILRYPRHWLAISSTVGSVAAAMVVAVFSHTWWPATIVGVAMAAAGFAALALLPE